MSELNLIQASSLPASKVMEFRQAFLSAGECSIPGSRGLHNYENYEDWLRLVNECSKPDNTAIGVETTTYFAVRNEDDTVVGCIELRYTLNEALAYCGGHIGFSTVPTERRKGYATQMLQMMLAEAKKIGLDKVLLTCDTDNIGSYKTIEACGGVREQEAPYMLDGEPFYRYWITIC